MVYGAHQLLCISFRNGYISFSHCKSDRYICSHQSEHDALPEQYPPLVVSLILSTFTSRAYPVGGDERFMPNGMCVIHN